MAWIEQVDESDATGKLEDTYRKLIRQRGKLANILKVQSLNPAALDAHLDLYMRLMFGHSRLSRGERESIGVAVSAANRCDYCINHHLVALRQHDSDAERIDTIVSGSGYRSLEGRLSSMLCAPED